MSEPEGFIARWSRRKRAAEDAEAPKESPAPKDEAESAHADEADRPQSDAPAGGSAAREPQQPLFDASTLPPIETITAESDIRAFLAPGVPAELTRAALRRAWSADPKIRDFVGLADYDWDFNAPGAITGFGSLEMTDELRREVARMVGRSLPSHDAEPSDPAPAEGQPDPGEAETPRESMAVTAALPTQQSESTCGPSTEEPGTSDNKGYNSQLLPQRDEDHIAAQYNQSKPDNRPSTPPRPRGRALPK
jgi:hypothetical protein